MNHWRHMTTLAVFLVFLSVAAGCKDEAPAQSAESTEKAETAEKKEALKPQSVVLFDRGDVLGYGGLQSLDGLKTMASDMMTKFQFLPAAAVPSMIEESLKSQMQVTSLEWLAGDKPFVIVVSNPENNDEAGLICVPLKDKALFEKSVPASAEKGKDGNALTLAAAMGGSLHINFIGESHAVFTEQPALFGKFKDLLSADLPKVKFENTIEFNLNGDGIRTIFKDDLKNMKAELARELDSDEAKQQLASAGLTKEQVEKLVGMVEELRSGQLGFKVVDGHFLVNGELLAQPNSLTGKMFKLLAQPVNPDMLGLLPANSYFKMASIMGADGSDFAKSLGLDTANQNSIAKIIDSGGEVFQMSAEDKAQLEKLTKDYETALGDKTTNVFGMHKSGSFPFSMVVLNSGIKDGPAADKATRGLMKLVWKLTADAVKKEMGGELPPGITVDPASFSKTWNSLSPLAAPFGVTLKDTVHAGTDGVAVDGVGISVKYEALPNYAESKSDMDMLKALLGDTLEAAMGTSKDRSAVALGPKATEVVRASLVASPSPVEGDMKGFLSRGQEKASSVLYINAIDFLKDLAQLSIPEARVLQGLSTAPKGEGMAITYGASKVDTVGLTLDISLSDAAAIVKAFNLSPM